MAEIHNTDLLKELKDGAKLQQLKDIIPSQLAEKVVPVMEVNPKLFRNIDIVRQVPGTTTGSIIAYTTLTDRDFYLNFIVASYIKDVVCDAATGRIIVEATIGGASREIIGFPIINLTAQTAIIGISFPIPIKIDRGTSISMSGTYTAGVMSRTLSVGGFEVLNPKA